jgi:hypothetical protein
MDAMPVLAGEAEVSLEQDTGIRAVGVIAARWHEDHGGGALEPATRQQLARNEMAWELKQSSLPSHYTLTLDPYGEGLSLRLVGVPTEDLSPGLILTAFLRPTLLTARIPEILYDDYGPIIADGAKAQLMAMGAAAWGNPQLAGFYEANFRRALRATKVAVSKDFTQTPLQATSDRMGYYE